MTRRRRLAASVMTLTLVIAGCGSGEQTPDELDIERTPMPATELVAPVDTAGLWLPMFFEDIEIIDPGWATPVHYLDGVYLGAAEGDGVLDFTAIDESGQTLWTVQRPASCSGFTLTTDSNGRSLAILTDAETTDTSLAAITASAYDLHTGEWAWGPVEVPGSYQGPGLVFSAAAGDFMGEGSPRTALNPDDGQALVVESDDDPTRVIGEYEGLVLTVDRTFLTARTSVDDDVWSISLEQQGWHASALTGSFERFKTPGHTVINTSADTGALIDLETGEVVADGVRDAAIDDMTGVTLILTGTELMAFDLDGQEIWATSVSEDTYIAVAGGVYVYLREGSAVRVHNALTGQVAEAYDPEGSGTIVVPEHLTAGGSGVLYDGSRRLIATRPPDFNQP